MTIIFNCCNLAFSDGTDTVIFSVRCGILFLCISVQKYRHPRQRPFTTIQWVPIVLLQYCSCFPVWWLRGLFHLLLEPPGKSQKCIWRRLRITSFSELSGMKLSYFYHIRMQRLQLDLSGIVTDAFPPKSSTLSQSPGKWSSQLHIRLWLSCRLFLVKRGW